MHALFTRPALRLLQNTSTRSTRWQRRRQLRISPKQMGYAQALTQSTKLQPSKHLIRNTSGTRMRVLQLAFATSRMSPSAEIFAAKCKVASSSPSAWSNHVMHALFTRPAPRLLHNTRTRSTRWQRRRQLLRRQLQLGGPSPTKMKTRIMLRSNSSRTMTLAALQLVRTMQPSAQMSHSECGGMTRPLIRRSNSSASMGGTRRRFASKEAIATAPTLFTMGKPSRALVHRHNAKHSRKSSQLPLLLYPLISSRGQGALTTSSGVATNSLFLEATIMQIAQMVTMSRRALV